MVANSTSDLITKLKNIVGDKYTLTDPNRTLPYRQGARFGVGDALAVVIPGTLLEQWEVLKACVEADVIVITQSANTGLTGGSTPDGNDYDRPIVIVSTRRLDGIQVIENGDQVVCLPGSTLFHLEKELKKYHRGPHSVIGSSCIGASVLGGVCNNSGGALIQRGPAYTQMAVFAQLDEQGQLHLVNHLGIELGDTPEAILENLQKRAYTDNDVNPNAGLGHDHHYCDHVRQIDADTPARYNADPSRHYEASGSAGRLMVFAVRLDTFPLEEKTAVFYIGSNDTNELDDIRRHILGTFKHLPISGEYIHRDAFDIAAVYGKHLFLAIQKLGTDTIPRLYAFKNVVDRIVRKIPFFPNSFSDWFAVNVCKLLPKHLPKSMRDYRDRYEHHLILKMSDDGIAEAEAFLKEYFADSEKRSGSYFRCNDKEAEAAMLHRFATAGAATVYRNVHTKTVEDLVALDIALRRNDKEWFETLPESISQHFIHKLYYGHFFCSVFHQDYLAKKGTDCTKMKEEMLAILDQRGAQYPAEHNVGHLYHANSDLKNFYHELDPTNSFNPGIGKTSKKKFWK
ncbi:MULTISPECIES: D-lactate dehydrogenase [unclassified Gilliamella]|uniref:D-lactate dehydrogenase n=1 Tax=unclassified Gilliamella TaxID=2685620 RepID=UPI00226988AE|nr:MULTISPECIES: D-lactate dehydrogenase [unclassified Gilliamella]MCX8597226.1 D-lactate dehydrogenase [Gilliamella sp. B3493]MCX8598853.1 D-lactate dehydrogenase [Gilliamella sp. B3486]MCX8689138.1 D-lactate dehydrogenase [Gilliamella sp. B2973]MCX8704841.1 D-lactate dehydrogenase [Gilliamella sp. B3127]